MDAEIATQYLQRARIGIHQALVHWDATDLHRVEESCGLLTVAAGEMRVFEAAVRAGAIPATDELCNWLLEAKQDIAQATRVVDACISFHRGLTARSGAAPLGYNAEGQIDAESTSVEPELHA